MSVKKAGISRKSGAGTFDLDHIVACSAAHFLVTMDVTEGEKRSPSRGTEHVIVGGYKAVERG
jgi:hypothetical protein